ncbi:MAG: hypothetical protein ACRD3W_18785 [Terriglobales bacterium]
MRTLIIVRAAWRALLSALLSAAGVLGVAVLAQTSPTDENPTLPAHDLNFNPLRVQRSLNARQSIDATEPTQTPTRFEAQADMAKIERSTPLLEAEFEAVYEKERVLDRNAAKMFSSYRSERGSDRVPRFGAHVVAFNKLWQESVKCDDLYSQYLDECANHFRRFHQPDMELAMRQSPCHASVLAIMGDHYAKLHHAVLMARAERLKLLAMENSLRTQFGVQPTSGGDAQEQAAESGSVLDRSVRGKIVPAQTPH